MAFPDYSTSPALNLYIAGVYVGENMTRGDVDAVLRQLMADGKVLSNSVTDLGASVLEANALATTVAAIQGSYPNSADAAAPRGVTGSTGIVGGSGGAKSGASASCYKRR